MDAPTRRSFLGLATKGVAVAVIGTAGVRLIGVAEALPADPGLARVSSAPDRAIPAQWGPGWGPGWGAPGWGPPPPRRRRRWVCWWHRGRRRCGWRW